jgi:hypothetical protein
MDSLQKELCMDMVSTSGRTDANMRASIKRTKSTGKAPTPTQMVKNTLETGKKECSMDLVA